MDPKDPLKWEVVDHPNSTEYTTTYKGCEIAVFEGTLEDPVERALRPFLVRKNGKHWYAATSLGDAETKLKRYLNGDT